MKCGGRVSDTAGGRWRRQCRTELDGDELSVAYAPLGVTRHKASQVGILSENMESFQKAVCTVYSNQIWNGDMERKLQSI